MKNRVFVTGIGTVNPLGLDVESTWQRAIKGQSAVKRISLFDPTDHGAQIAAEVKSFDADARFGRRDARRMDRFVQFAVSASEEALNNANFNITDDNRDRVGAIIGTGIGGVQTLGSEANTLQEKGPRRVSPFMVPMMLPDTASGQVAIIFGARGPNLCITSACASSTNAIGEASEIIRRGAADVIISGGAEAAITPLTIAAFGNMGALSTRNDVPEAACRPFDHDRDGFVAGEGAAILILESEAHALNRGATIHAEILGYGLTNDAFHITAPASDGAAAILCMKLALKNSGIDPSQIDYINAHGTSTSLNDKTETLAIKQVFGDYAYHTPISSTKSMHGHLLGGAGALEAIMGVQAIRKGIIPPTINYDQPDPACDLDYVPNKSRTVSVETVLSNSFGFGGHNASIILSSVRNKETPAPNV